MGYDKPLSDATRLRVPETNSFSQNEMCDRSGRRSGPNGAVRPAFVPQSGPTNRYCGAIIVGIANFARNRQPDSWANGVGIMRKTVQEWLCANRNGMGTAKKKFSCRKTSARLRQSPGGTNEDPTAVAPGAKKKRAPQKSIRKRKPR